MGENLASVKEPMRSLWLDTHFHRQNSTVEELFAPSRASFFFWPLGISQRATQSLNKPVLD